MDMITNIDTEALTLSGVIAGVVLVRAADRLEAIGSEMAWRRPRNERRLTMVTGKQQPRFAIYGKSN